MPALSPACLLLLVVTTVANQLWPSPAWVWTAGAAAALFLAREHRRVPQGIQRVAVTLGVLTVLLLPLLPDPAAVLRRGLAIGALMASLILSISLLSRAALRSRHTEVVAHHLLATPLHSRYTWFALAGQFFGGLLGMAGISMLLQIATRSTAGDAADRRALLAAVTRSFAAASLWSPVFSNISIVLALYPGQQWFAVVPLTLTIGAALVAVGLAMEHWRTRGRAPVAGTQPPADSLARALLPLGAAMGCFLVLVVVLSWQLAIAVAAAIALLVAPAALLAHTLQAASGPGRLARGFAELRADTQRLPQLAGEVAIFIAAGCGGTVIAAAIPEPWTLAIGAMVSHSAVLAALLLVMAVVCMSFLAVHPVLSVVLLATCLPPSVVNLPEIVHVAAILVGWSIAACVSPFSMAALMTSRFAGLPVYAVSVQINARFALVCIALAALVLGLAAQLPALQG